MKERQPTQEDIDFADAVKACIGREGADLDLGTAIIPLLAQIIGNCIAFLDSDKFTSDAIMATIAAGIEMGNQAAIEAVMNGDISIIGIGRA